MAVPQLCEKIHSCGFSPKGTAYMPVKYTFFSACNCKTRVLQLPLLFILLIVSFFSCSKMKTQRNIDPSEGNPLSNGSRHEQETDTSGERASSQELPDLSEAIARLSGEAAITVSDREAFVDDFWRWIFGEAGIPERLARKVASSALESPGFIMELLVLLQQDPFTYRLVDKQHALPENYEPEDLIPLTAGIYRLGRDGLALRESAVNALKEMAAAAATEGIVFVIGSAYRSAAYQAQIYEREVSTYGREIADRESAQPGKSQHQLGLVLDFAPIDDSFANTSASAWLSSNSGRFGWSLSYPNGYEEVTGYRWESWHYRYVGKDLTLFIDKYFDGIQQYALQFINAWQNLSAE
jgi:D-alanyl-D-alanine carboxypeptidase